MQALHAVSDQRLAHCCALAFLAVTEWLARHLTYLLQIARLLINVCAVVPGGLVVFVPSFSYLAQVRCIHQTSPRPCSINFAFVCYLSVQPPLMCKHGCCATSPNTYHANSITSLMGMLAAGCALDVDRRAHVPLRQVRARNPHSP